MGHSFSTDMRSTMIRLLTLVGLLFAIPAHAEVTNAQYTEFLNAVAESR